jgi:GntR family transcriptional regulator, rspAB operon transcriptional repressor
VTVAVLRSDGARPEVPPERFAARRTSKAQHVYEAIKEAILSGELAPGSAIDKLALCDRFGMSRFPVSTAVNRLAFEKLVVVEPQHGSFVSRISIADVREFMLIRRAIEGDVAAQAAGRTSTALVDELDRSLRYQAAAVDAQDYAGFYQLDVGFHQIIVRSLAMTHAAEVLDRLLSHLERVRRLLIAPQGRAQKTLAEHRRIVQAIAAGDGSDAFAAARDHLDQTSAMFERFAHDNPTLFARPA